MESKMMIDVMVIVLGIIGGFIVGYFSGSIDKIDTRYKEEENKVKKE